MSGSEMGGGREQFPVGFNKPQPPTPQLQNSCLDYAADGASVYKAAPMFHQAATVAANTNGVESVAAAPQGMCLGQPGGSSGEPLKRKRGRPRKYGPDGAMSLGLTVTPAPPHHLSLPIPQPGPGPVTQPTGPSPPPASASASPGSNKKRRGRPRGSVNKNHSKRSGNLLPLSSHFN